MVASIFTIPPSYPSTTAYAESRAALLEVEHAAAFDYSACKSASPTEKKANDIVKALLDLESSTVYGVHHNGLGHEPAHQFRRARHLIDESKIFEIAKRAPKGALLHCHLDAMLPPQELIEIATGMANMGIRTDCALTHKGFFEHAMPTFHVLGKKDVEKCKDTDVFSSSYLAGQWMLLSKFKETFPGGAGKADEWIASKIMLDVDDIYHTSQTVNGYFSLFLPLSNLRSRLLIRIGYGSLSSARSQFCLDCSDMKQLGASTSSMLSGTLRVMESITLRFASD